MDVAPIPTVPAANCQIAPALDVKQRFGPALEATGATDLQVLDPTTLGVTYGDATTWTIAANLLETTVRGATLAMNGPLTGVPYAPTTHDYVDMLANLPGVFMVANGMVADRPELVVRTTTRTEATLLDQLVRDTVLAPGRGGTLPLAVRFEWGPPVIPFEG